MKKQRMGVSWGDYSIVVIGVLIGAFVWLSSGIANAQSKPEWRSVTMGRPGDRWVDTMRFTRVARAQRNKVYGYEVSFQVPGFEDLTFFWPRNKIDFVSDAERDPESRPPGFRQLSMILGEGRLFYPDTVTATSLPKVHRAILIIEADYTSQARGAIAAAEAFGTVATLGTMIPAARVPAVPPRASVGTTTSRLPKAKPASKPTPSKPATRPPSKPATRPPSKPASKPGCFVAGTAVHTPTGPVAIDRLRPGDVVMSRDSATGEMRHDRAVATFVRHDVPVFEVTIVGREGTSETLRTTAEHPFWVTSRGWVRAVRLTVRDPLQAADGTAPRVVSVHRTGDTATVYNIEVAGSHTYFVGKRGAWVHNKPMRNRGIRISRRWRARKITDPKCAKGCEHVAKQIQKHIGGEIHTIKATKDADKFIGRYRGHNMEWFWHKVVVKDGRVYDAFTGHKGLPIAEYKKLWQFGDALRFGF